jgi:hypothetical protein
VHAAQIGAGSDVIQPFKPNYAGWWDTPAKRPALQDYVTAQNGQLRLAAWKKMQAVILRRSSEPNDRLFRSAIWHQHETREFHTRPTTRVLEYQTGDLIEHLARGEAST